MKTTTLACALLFVGIVCSSVSLTAGEFTGAVVGPLAENDGYYARFSGDTFKRMSWDEARRYAESLYIKRGGKIYKGFLFTPNTASENAYVTNTLKPNEDWIGMFQAPHPRRTNDKWMFLNNRSVGWYGWGTNEPDDQKNGAWTSCSLANFFTGIEYSSDNPYSFAPTTDTESTGFNETGCENCGMIRADGKWKDKECESHGNGFIVEFRNL